MTEVREGKAGSLKELCQLLGRTRQAYYKQQWKAEKGVYASELLISEVKRLREQQKRIGVRKLYSMTEEIRGQEQMKIGRDRFFDLMRDEGLLVRRRRRKKPRTTFSSWWLKKYPNLAKESTVSGPNQLWVSDITYIRVKSSFCYLSLVTDAYSRKIVGYCVSEDLTAKGSITALEMAMRSNPRREGLIHHSDRGIQYYSKGYIKLLGTEVRISMSEHSDPLENAIAERVNGILKDELLARKFGSFEDAQREVATAVSTYNDLRPHLSCDMLTPTAAHTRSGTLKRRWKNYRSLKQLKPWLELKDRSVNHFQD